MDHQEATRLQLVERYLLSEMTPAQQDEFEVHLFDCPRCAEALRAAAIFVDNTRSVLREEVQRPPGASPADIGLPGGDWLSRMRQWFQQPVFAPLAAALAIVVLAQNVVQIPALRQQIASVRAPQSVAAFALPPVTRGNEPVVTPPPGAKSIVLWFDLSVASQGGYICEFAQDPGSTWLSLKEQPAPGSDALYLQLDPSRIPAGRNLLTVKSPDGGELMRYRFIYKP